jgi:hypothetical protein
MNRLDFEKELKTRAIRLLLMRAGGRYMMFEAGQLYQTCLLLGMKDGRPGKLGEQEHNWEQIVAHCFSEKEAKQKLKELLNSDQNYDSPSISQEEMPK